MCISKSARILNNSQPIELSMFGVCLFVFNLDGLKLKNEIEKLLK